MKNLLNLLSGRKTYITAAIYALLTFLQAIGFSIPGFDVSLIEGILQAAGLATLRAGVSKV